MAIKTDTLKTPVCLRALIDHEDEAPKAVRRLMARAIVADISVHSITFDHDENGNIDEILLWGDA